MGCHHRLYGAPILFFLFILAVSTPHAAPIYPLVPTLLGSLIIYPPPTFPPSFLLLLLLPAALGRIYDQDCGLRFLLLYYFYALIC